MTTLKADCLYLDQLGQDVADCIPNDGNAVSKVKSACSKEYDEHFEYRFMEALRNYVQHRGIPVRVVRLKSGWTSFDESGRMEFALEFFSQRRELATDDKFKKSVLNEIPTEIELRTACRRYVESLSEINEVARGAVSGAVDAARQAMEVMHRRYAAVYSDSSLGLSAMKLDDEGNVLESNSILLE